MNREKRVLEGRLAARTKRKKGRIWVARVEKRSKGVDMGRGEDYQD
jgi:hypothetical protein